MLTATFVPLLLSLEKIYDSMVLLLISSESDPKISTIAFNAAAESVRYNGKDNGA